MLTSGMTNPADLVSSSIRKLNRTVDEVRAVCGLGESGGTPSLPLKLWLDLCLATLLCLNLKTDFGKMLRAIEPTVSSLLAP